MNFSINQRGKTNQGEIRRVKLIVWFLAAAKVWAANLKTQEYPAAF